MKLTHEQLIAKYSLVKRFEYTVRAVSIPYGYEIPVSAYLDSYKKACVQLNNIKGFVTISKPERSGKKVRCSALVRRIKWYAFKKLFKNKFA